MIRYTSSIEGITPSQLHGFFVGWPSPPSTETHLKLLQSSDHVILALDIDKVVGFITAITDGVLSAYIPLLEVLPDYQGMGIGKQLTKRMLAILEDLYMIDVICDDTVVGFYQSLGLQPARAMIRRNYSAQAGNDLSGSIR